MGQIYQTTVDNVAIDRRLLASGTKVVVSTADAKKIAATALADELTDLGPGLVFTGLELLTGASAADVELAAITPGFSGRIVAAFAVVTTAVSTAAKNADVRIEIEGTPLVGGVVSLTSANATPAGKVVGATQVVADNEFLSTDEITFVVDGEPVDFAEGAVMFGILVAPIRKDGAAVV